MPPKIKEIRRAMMLVCKTSHHRASGVINRTITQDRVASATIKPRMNAKNETTTSRREALESGGGSLIACEMV